MYGLPITTKLAAFFRLIFLYSEMTSIFLLLILGTSCIDKSWTPLASVDLDLGVSLGFCLTGVGARWRRRQLMLLVARLCRTNPDLLFVPLSQHRLDLVLQSRRI